MSPAMDTFFDANTLPKLVINNNNLYDAMLNLTNNQVESNMGTVWTDWETGVDNMNDRVNYLGRESGGFKGYNERVNDFFSVGSVKIAPTSQAAKDARNEFHVSHDVNTSMAKSTAFGERILDIQLSRTMRSIPVKIKAERLKPRTKYHAFFDDINVSQWFCSDRMETDFSDNKNRYAGSPNDNPDGFGLPITSDDEGNLTGVFIIPNGKPPQMGTKFTGRMEDIQYDIEGVSRKFTTGVKSFKLVSSSSPSANITEIGGYAKADFVSKPVILDKKDTIISTRTPEQTTNTTMLEDVRFNYDGDGSDYDPSSVPNLTPTPYDPIAQTFRIDKNNPNGVFVTELDVFFREKDLVQGVEAYLVSTDANTPTTTILPHSRVVKAF